MITVLVACDHEILRHGMRHLVEEQSDIRVCAEASDGREALEMIEKHRPDVVLLDVASPRLGGLETLAQMRAQSPGVKAILLSAHAEPALVQSALALGVEGFLLKSGRVSEIAEAIRAVSRGESYFSSPVVRDLVAHTRPPRRGEKGEIPRLSEREHQVLRLIADGLSAKEIARDLEISTKTVEAHRTSLMRKLGVRKATELVRYALRHGLIEP